jgi:hypothetical protein
MNSISKGTSILNSSKFTGISTDQEDSAWISIQAVYGKGVK